MTGDTSKPAAFTPRALCIFFEGHRARRSAREADGAASRADPARIRSRRGDYARLHRRQCLPRLEGGAHLRFVDSGRRDLDGRTANAAQRDDLREQYRSDSGVGGGNALVGNLRAAGLSDDRLVERLPVCAVVRNLRSGRNPRRNVQRSAAARAGDAVRPPLSRRCRRRRGS